MEGIADVRTSGATTSLSTELFIFTSFIMDYQSLNLKPRTSEPEPTLHPSMITKVSILSIHFLK